MKPELLSGSNLSRRRFISSAISIPLLLALPGRAASNSTIHKLEGQVYVNNRLADMDTRLRAGDKIVVAYGGELAMSMGGDAFLLREGSVLEIAKGNNLLVSGLRLLTGAMLAVFDQRNSPVQIVTSTATIGIRGTGVYLSAEPHKLYTCTCYGKTELRFGRQIEQISATHHNAHEISAGDDGTMTMKSMEVIDHTDDELRMLENYVGRKPLFDL
jgi:hypothetical protein